MKCPTCLKDLVFFQTGRGSTFTPIITSYVCFKCMKQLRNRKDCNQYIWEYINVEELGFNEEVRE